jgi:ATP-dependent helicase/nuclease subunit B
MIRLVVGPYAELEVELASALRSLRAPAGEEAPGGPEAMERLPAPVAVLAPSRRLLAHLQRALARDHGLALANVFFETFQSFARRLLIEEGIPAARLAEAPAVEERILERALDRLPAGHPLHGLTGTPGLLGALLATIRDLDEARVSSSALADPAMEEIRGAGGLEAIQPLLAALEEERAALGLLNRAAVVAAAADLAPKSRWLRSHVAVFHYGAYDLTQHQLDWLAALGEAVDTTVLFPGASDRPGRLLPAYRFAETTLAELRKKAGAHERWLPAGRRIPPDPEAVEAGDPAEEFELIAETIRGLAAGGGCKAAEIVVAVRSLEGVLPHAAAAFARAGIPWETPAATPLPALPTGRGVVALARALAGEAPPDVIVELLAQSWLRVFPEEARPLARAAALARRLPPFARSSDWEAMAGAGDPERDGADVAAARAIGWGLAVLERHAAGFAPEAAWSTHVDRWVATFEALAPAPAPEHAAVLEAGLAAVEELRRLDAVEPAVRLADFHRRAIRAIERATVRWREHKGGVRLLSAMDARGVRPRVLFVAQANDGVFPRVAHEDPFLRDDARRALSDPLGYKIQTKRADGGAEERLLWGLLAAAPTERLYLFWHAEDGQGRPVAPSPFVLPLLGGEAGLERARAAARSLRAAARETALAAVHPETVRRSAKVMRELERPSDEGPTDRDGPPASPAARPLRLGVTEFRDLARCPFRVWLRAGLEIEAPRGPREWWEPEPWRIGSVLHQALREGLSRLLAGAHATPEGAARAELPPALAPRLPILARLPVLKAALEADLERLVAQALAAEQAHLAAERLIPDRFEERVEKAFGARGLVLSAQADRLDRGPNGAAHVTDYKSHVGRTGRPQSAKLDPEVLQVSLYLHLLAPGAEPMLSVVHLGLGMRPQVQPVREAGAKARSLVGDALALAAALEEIWLAGRASPWPTDLLARTTEWKAECRSCDYRTACRGDHEPTRARLERSADLNALREVLPDARREAA